MTAFDGRFHVRLVDVARAIDQRTSLIVLLGGEAGLRCGEMIALEWGDVDLAKRQLCVRRSDWNGQVGTPKGGRQRYVPLTRRLTAALAEHRHLRSKRVWLRSGNDVLWNTYSTLLVDKFDRGLASVESSSSRVVPAPDPPGRRHLSGVFPRLPSLAPLNLATHHGRPPGSLARTHARFFSSPGCTSGAGRKGGRVRTWRLSPLAIEVSGSTFGRDWHRLLWSRWQPTR